MNTVFQKLKDAIKEYPRQRISLNEMYEMVENIAGSMELSVLSRESQERFEQLVGELIEGNVLELPKTLKPNHRGLYSIYRKVTPSDENDTIKAEIIAAIRKPMEASYYLNHPKAYLKDKEYIKLITDFLENHRTPAWVTVNERSYEIFGDEKFLRGNDRARSRGESILRNLGLSFDDLFCRLTLEPFFCFSKDELANKHRRRIFIIENKDTFWSFKDTAFSNPSVEEIDMVIYGEGRKIISSFQFVREYGLDEQDAFYYFGDLDPEGINIYAELSEYYKEYDIQPYVQGYEQMLLAAEGKEIKKAYKDQRLNEKALDSFIGYFTPIESEKIRKLILSGGYIPQEAFSAERMRQVYNLRSS